MEILKTTQNFLVKHYYIKFVSWFIRTWDIFFSLNNS